MAQIPAVERHAFIQAVSEKATQMQVPVAIAIVNQEGHLLSLERMDNAGFITPEIAWSKAFTVAAFRAMSPRFADGQLIAQWFKERNPQMLVNASVFTGGRVVVSGGSAPVFKDDDLVGAYGISGGTSDQDEALGRYAREKLGWASRSERDELSSEARAHINEIYRQVGLEDRVL